MTLSAFQQQIELFDADADYWWSEGGPFDLLHAMNPLRMSFITSSVGSLDGLKVLDVGCGGGILSEPLARLGAYVTGIDASLGAISAARDHAKTMGLSIDYHHGVIDTLCDTSAHTFDVVIASEIIEHVPCPRQFLSACVRMLKPDHKGIIVSTLNRTAQSYVGAIIGAEYLLRWVPRGTHEWHRFLKPSEIDMYVNEYGLSWKGLQGMRLNPFAKTWSFTDDLSMNYIGILR